jgi:UDP:flavonoid glycosyltransferase YjiC (YdhE family)
MLAEPVAKQFEQILNARYLEKEGHGLSTDRIDEARLREFLQRIPEFETNLSRYSQDGNKELLSRLESAMNAAAKGIPAEAE